MIRSYRVRRALLILAQHDTELAGAGLAIAALLTWVVALIVIGVTR